MKKSVLITGASRGIGKAIAIEFARNGHPLFLTASKSEDSLLQLKKEIKDHYSVPCHTYIGDVGSLESVEEMFQEAGKLYGDVEILVNNAGISHIGLLQDLSEEDWQRIIQTNLSSAFHCCKMAIPSMVRNKSGKIINISSVWGIHGASCEVAYSTTKGGLNAFTKALAKELAPSNIQVNAVACGAIDTQMNHFLEEDERISLLNEIPSGRMGLPEEVAEVVYNIAIGTTYLTGQIISLDGGWL